jgi:hypothetical protein
MTFPATIADFQAYFARDFNFAPANDDNNIDDYIVSADITKAITEAQLNFNECLFADPTIPFIYLAAYTLVVNLQNSTRGLSSQAKFPISSNSVGGVSISFQIPERYSKDAFLQQYTKNGYGMKYLELVLPYLVGVASAAYAETSFR